MAPYLETLDGKKHTIGLIRSPITCFRCGLCCTNFLVKLTSSELKILAHRLNVSNHDLLLKYVKKTPIGFLGSVKPARDVRIFSAMALSA